MSDAGSLDRRRVAATLLANRRELLVVTGLGSTTYDCAAVEDNARNFYLWGAMGGAAMVGLGLALAQREKPVLVLTGDGECLMGLGALGTIAVHSPANLSIVVIDNERYGETGRQPSHTAHGLDLAGVARAAGIGDSRLIRSEDGVADLAQDIHRRARTIFACVKCRGEEAPRVLPPRDGALLKDRFRHAVAGQKLFEARR